MARFISFISYFSRCFRSLWFWSFILTLLPASSAQAFSLSSFFQSGFGASSGQNSSQTQDIVQTISNQTEGRLRPQVLEAALRAYNKLHTRGYDPQGVLTVIDYSRPSTERRLWVINLKTLQVDFQTLVAHAQNSGNNVPTAFSNRPESHETSIGVYLTANTYIGKHGRSLRLEGLEPGFNSNALARDIVVHPAEYVSEAFARLHGRLGRSWGCPAVSPEVAQPMINQIKDGTVLVAYYPDPNWLKHSAYLAA